MVLLKQKTDPDRTACKTVMAPTFLQGKSKVLPVVCRALCGLGLTISPFMHPRPATLVSLPCLQRPRYSPTLRLLCGHPSAWKNLPGDAVIVNSCFPCLCEDVAFSLKLHNLSHPQESWSPCPTRLLNWLILSPPTRMQASQWESVPFVYWEILTKVLTIIGTQTIFAK